MYSIRIDRIDYHFLAQPKTGSQTVARAILDAGGRKLNGHHNNSSLQCEYKPGDVVFSTVRRHKTWIASLWKHNSSPLSLKEYIRTERNQKGDSWIKSDSKMGCYRAFWNCLPRSTNVLRFETIVDDLFKLTGLKLDRIEYKNYDEHLTPEVEEIIEATFCEEIKLIDRFYSRS